MATASGRATEPQDYAHAILLRPLGARVGNDSGARLSLSSCSTKSANIPEPGTQGQVPREKRAACRRRTEEGAGIAAALPKFLPEPKFLLESRLSGIWNGFHEGEGM